MIEDAGNLQSRACVSGKTMVGIMVYGTTIWYVPEKRRSPPKKEGRGGGERETGDFVIQEDSIEDTTSIVRK